MVVFFFVDGGECFVGELDLCFRGIGVGEGGDVEEGVAFVCEAFVVAADDDAICGCEDG